jgi:hypothetical protein
MRLDDYHDAVGFRAFGVPDPSKWVESLAAAARAATLEGFC